MSATAVCGLGAMSPGPSLAVVIRNTIGNGRAHGLVTAWSHALGVSLYALLTAFGLAVVISSSRPVYITVTAGGAAYLLYLGIGAFRSAARVDTKEATRQRGLAAAAREGFLTALLNPKVAVFFTAVFSQFLRPGMGAGDHFLLSGTATLVDGLWYSLVAVLLTHAGWTDLLARHARHIDRIAGVVLILVALAGVLRLACL